MRYLYTSPTRSAVPRRCFELTGQVTPVHSPALADLVGRIPGAPPEQPTGSQPTTSCRGPGAVCHPWRQGWRHGWRSPCTRRDTALLRVGIDDLRVGTGGGETEGSQTAGWSSAKTSGADPTCGAARLEGAHAVRHAGFLFLDSSLKPTGRHHHPGAPRHL